MTAVQRPPAPPRPNTVGLHVRVPVELEARLRALAAPDGLALSAVVRWVLEAGLDAVEAA